MIYEWGDIIFFIVNFFIFVFFIREGVKERDRERMRVREKRKREREMIHSFKTHTHTVLLFSSFFLKQLPFRSEDIILKFFTRWHLLYKVVPEKKSDI